MTAAITTLPTAQPDPSEIMSQVLLMGDLSKLSHEEKTSYFMQTCQSLGLNPYTKPLDYIRLSGREVLYATKGCADQLRSNRRISLQVTDRKVSGDLMIVTVRATTPDGRFDEDMAAVSIKGLQGEALANAAMKAITKAKRRVTLSICGLGMLDESEVRSVLESEALRSSELDPRAGPVQPRPKPKVAAIEPPKDRPGSAWSEEPPQEPKATAMISVLVPGDDVPLTYPKTKRGALAAYKEIEKTVTDGGYGIVGLNRELLDWMADKVGMAEEVEAMRAAATEAEIQAEEAEPDEEPDTFVQDFVDSADGDDDFPGDKPNISDT